MHAMNKIIVEKPTTYCEAVLRMEKTSVHRVYHDNHYGYTIEDDNELFGRLILEINQAGLSWTTILNKQDNFRKAYHQFNDCWKTPALSATVLKSMPPSTMQTSFCNCKRNTVLSRNGLTRIIQKQKRNG